MDIKLWSPLCELDMYLHAALTAAWGDDVMRVQDTFVVRQAALLRLTDNK